MEAASRSSPPAQCAGPQTWIDDRARCLSQSDIFLDAYRSAPRGDVVATSARTSPRQFRAAGGGYKRPAPEVERRTCPPERATGRNSPVTSAQWLGGAAGVHPYSLPTRTRTRRAPPQRGHRSTSRANMTRINAAVPSHQERHEGAQWPAARRRITRAQAQAAARSVPRLRAPRVRPWRGSTAADFRRKWRGSNSRRARRGQAFRA
jgi:hypothetical protein